MAPPTLYSLDDLAEKVPGWPLSPWSTRQRIRAGQLKAIKLGRRYYLTDQLISDFIEAQITQSTRVA